jgi:hypothetical protein
LPSGRFRTGLRWIKYYLVSPDITYTVDCSYTTREWLLSSTCTEFFCSLYSADLIVVVVPSRLDIFILHSPIHGLFVGSAIH